jgi:hypothetical protein
MAKDKAVSPELLTAKLPRNFSLGTAESIRALTIGVPSYAARKRRIEDLLEDLTEHLREALSKLGPASLASPASRHEAALALAATLDLSKVNALVEAHNRYYPIEANLPVDPRTGAYLVKRGTPFEPEPAVTPARLVALLDGEPDE